MEEHIDGLTAREEEALRLLSEGMSNQEIADALCVTVKTVETHLHHIFQKLGVKHRTQAVRWYMKNRGQE
jgi:NarL family two-component system response regulator LiaR